MIFVKGNSVVPFVSPFRANSTFILIISSVVRSGSRNLSLDITRTFRLLYCRLSFVVYFRILRIVNSSQQR